MTDSIQFKVESVFIFMLKRSPRLAFYFDKHENIQIRLQGVLCTNSCLCTNIVLKHPLPLVRKHSPPPQKKNVTRCSFCEIFPLLRTQVNTKFCFRIKMLHACDCKQETLWNAMYGSLLVQAHRVKLD